MNKQSLLENILKSLAIVFGASLIATAVDVNDNEFLSILAFITGIAFLVVLLLILGLV